MCNVFVPVSHCKDTYYFDKTNNYFKKSERKGDQVSDLLCPKLSELLYNSICISALIALIDKVDY